MGFLHEGHLSLVRKSKEICDITIVSIFVNPIQFTPTEDLDKYPRNIERDSKLLQEQGVNYLFYPSVEKIYPKNFQTFINVEHITKQLEGEFRPTHFKGVTTVVNILFNCVNPDYAFFGQKDAQQAAVIKQMVADLNMNIKIVVCPIVREPDGLAMSSRNIYLSKTEREDALVLYKSLQAAIKSISNGERKSTMIVSEMVSMITGVRSSKLDYVKIVDSKSFEMVEDLESDKEYYILIACKIGHTRLIDNEQVKIN